MAHCLPHESPLSIHLGHEKSADEGNNVFLSNGLEVNHQYDKSAAFVALTEAYLTPISTRISTPLAKLYELEVCWLDLSVC